jgi:hypothetical protein
LPRKRPSVAIKSFSLDFWFMARLVSAYTEIKGDPDMANVFHSSFSFYWFFGFSKPSAGVNDL